MTGVEAMTVVAAVRGCGEGLRRAAPQLVTLTAATSSSTAPSPFQVAGVVRDKLTSEPNATTDAAGGAHQAWKNEVAVEGFQSLPSEVTRT